MDEFCVGCGDLAVHAQWVVLVQFTLPLVGQEVLCQLRDVTHALKHVGKFPTTTLNSPNLCVCVTVQNIVEYK